MRVSRKLRRDGRSEREAEREAATHEESDLSSSDSDVSSGNIGQRSNVSGELLHESVAELPDLVVGLSLGVEVASSERSRARSQGDGGETTDKSARFCLPARAQGKRVENDGTDPFPPPMESPVRAFLKICSNPRLQERTARAREEGSEGESASELVRKGGIESIEEKD